MKQNNFLKKALTLVGAAVIAGAVGLGASNHSQADAASAQTTVHLVKYAISGDATPKPATGYDKQDVTGKDVVDGAEFSVYDVTDQYWARYDGELKGKSEAEISTILNQTKTDDDSKATTENNFFDISKEKIPDGAIATGKTENGGEVDFKLDNYNDAGQYKVYLFRENSAPAGYALSADFVLSLPAKGTDANKSSLTDAWVYPKDQVTGTYQLKFTKVDANNNQTPLQGAEFYIKNGNKYAIVTGYEGGFADKPLTVEWKESKDEDGNPIVPAGATVFTSNAEGLFGFTATTQTTKNGSTYGLDPDTDYTIEEKTAPKGYNTDAKIDGKDAAGVGVNPTDTDTNTVVEDTPKGILPHTGGAGIIAIVAAGLAITVIGVAAYSKRRANA